MSGVYVLESGQEEIKMLDLADLFYEEANVIVKLLWCMVVEYIHVDSLIPTGEEGGSIRFHCNTLPDPGKDQCSRVYRLQIPPRHLKN